MVQNLLTCRICGKTEDLDLYYPGWRDTPELKEAGMCFECAFWHKTFSHLTDDSYIIDGQLWRAELCFNIIGMNSVKKRGRVILYDAPNHSVAYTDKYQIIGDIPQNLKKLHPDQYKVISADVYKRVAYYRGGDCQKLGCFDRYQCFWYDVEKEKKLGAWNEIPKTHKPGNECCESYINKNTMYVNNNNSTNNGECL